MQGAHKLDWRPEQYRGKTGGSIPKILHHIFLDGEAEYDKCVPDQPTSLAILWLIKLSKQPGANHTPR